jgi:hypothetical protein
MKVIASPKKRQTIYDLNCLLDFSSSEAPLMTSLTTKLSLIKKSNRLKTRHSENHQFCEGI